MVADIISVPTNPFGTHEEGWGGQKRCVSNCVPCVPLCFCFALAPICSSKGVLLNAHVQHSVACLGVSEIRAYLSQLCAFWGYSKSCHDFFTLPWSLLQLQVSWTCPWHACCMMHAWCIIPWHPMNSSQHPLFTIRHPFQVTWPPHSPQTHLPWVKNEPLLKWIS